MNEAPIPLKPRRTWIKPEEWNPCKCSVVRIDSEWGKRGHRAVRFKHPKLKRSFRPRRSQTIADVIRQQQAFDDQKDHGCLSDQFDQLADKWERATEQMSSPIQMAEHPAYQQIIAMGEEIVPLILQRMRDRGGHWFWALSLLAKDDPMIPQASRGIVSEMREAWLRWGSKHGYC